MQFIPNQTNKQNKTKIRGVRETSFSHQGILTEKVQNYCCRASTNRYRLSISLIVVVIIRNISTAELDPNGIGRTMVGNTIVGDHLDCRWSQKQWNEIFKDSLYVFHLCLGLTSQ